MNLLHIEMMLIKFAFYGDDFKDEITFSKKEMVL